MLKKKKLKITNPVNNQPQNDKKVAQMAKIKYMVPKLRLKNDIENQAKNSTFSLEESQNLTARS